MIRNRWTKKMNIFLAFACVALVGFSGIQSGKRDTWAAQVSGVPISVEVYRYFLEESRRERKNLSESARREDVKKRCVRYIALNSEIVNHGVALSQNNKAKVAELTAGTWQVFGGYYRKVGVGKSTINKIIQSKVNGEQLFEVLYDKGGSREVPENSIETKFYGEFVAYDGIRVFQTKVGEDGREREMTLEEKKKLKKILEEMVVEANDGVDFFSLTNDERYAETIGFTSPVVMVARKGDGVVPDEFFGKIRGLDPGKVSLLELGTFFLLARGVNMRVSPGEFYQIYRKECLLSLKNAEFKKELEDLGNQLILDENISVISKLFHE